MKLCLACHQKFDAPDWRCPACGESPEVRNGFLSFLKNSHAEGGFRPEFFAELSQLEASHFWFKARNRLIAHTLAAYYPNCRSFLEVGCGSGFVLSGLSKVFPSMRLCGSEFFSEGLPYAAKRIANAELFQADARALPFVEDFDVVGAFDVLEHIEEDVRALAQFYKATRPGGGILLTVPQHPWLWSAADEHACHVRRYNRNDLITKVSQVGFRVVYVASFVSLLFPVMVLSRLRGGKKSSSSNPSDELQIHPFLNTTFTAIMAFEGILLRLGVKFPLGGSLLLAARKD